MTELLDDDARLERAAIFVAHYTVFLYADTPAIDRPPPEQLGSGTLVACSGQHFILTARHVWAKLANADSVGVTVELDRDLLQVPTLLVTPVVVPREYLANEPRGKPWGPDLALLPLAGKELGTIEAHRSFWPLDSRATTRAVNVEESGLWFICGAPEALTVETGERRRELHPQLYGSRDVHYRPREDLDYIDVIWDREGRRNTPASLGGMSGGGIWFITDEDGPEDPEPTLRGVAFYASLPAEDGRGFVRGHGPRSLHALASCI